MQRAGESRRSRRREVWIWPFHLWALSGFAVAQPLFDQLGRQAEFLVAHDVRPVDLWVLVAVLVLLPVPAVLAVAALGRPFPRLAAAVRTAMVGVLVAATVLPALDRLPGLPGLLLVAAALALGAAAAVAYRRLPAARLFLTLLTPAILLFPAVFLLSWPVRSLAFPRPPIAGRGIASNGTPVVMVIFDELSTPTLLGANGRIDERRWPHFAALAETSYWYPYATTVADGTHYSVPAMLDGKYPAGRRLPKADYYPDNLFTLLGGSYRLEVFEGLTSLCPEVLCGETASAATWRQQAGSLIPDVALVYLHLLLPADLTTRLPEITNHWRNFGRAAYEQDRAQAFETFLDSIRTAEDSRLYFHHSMLPHVPWQYLPSGKMYRDFRLYGVENGFWTGGDWLIQQGLQRYLLQLMFVDRLLGRLIDTLRQVGLFDRSLIVMTADHGTSFVAGENRRALRPGNFPEVLLVPLLVKLPGQRQGVQSDRRAETIDILPTVAEVLELGEIPWAVDGRSLVGDDFPRRSEKVAFRSLQKLIGPLRFGARELEEGSEILASRLRRFGPGPEGVFEIGSGRDLVGRPSAEVAEQRGAARAAIELASPAELEDVDPAASRLPAFISGTVLSPKIAGGPVAVAIAVNGTIRAVTETFGGGRGRARFAAMVPEAAFSAGRNRVEALVLDPGY